jgi:hypothetical protein
MAGRPKNAPRPRRSRRYVRPDRHRSEHYVVGNFVLVIRNGTIVTVMPKGWLL